LSNPPHFLRLVTCSCGGIGKVKAPIRMKSRQVIDPKNVACRENGIRETRPAETAPDFPVRTPFSYLGE